MEASNERNRRIYLEEERDDVHFDPKHHSWHGSMSKRDEIDQSVDGSCLVQRNACRSSHSRQKGLAELNSKGQENHCRWSARRSIHRFVAAERS